MSDLADVLRPVRLVTTTREVSREVAMTLQNRIAALEQELELARGMLKLRDEEIRMAHVQLELFDVPSYGRTDFPLPLGRRIYLLGDHRNRLVRRCRAAGLPTD